MSPAAFGACLFGAGFVLGIIAGFIPGFMVGYDRGVGTSVQGMLDAMFKGDK